MLGFLPLVFLGKSAAISLSFLSRKLSNDGAYKKPAFSCITCLLTTQEGSGPVLICGSTIYTHMKSIRQALSSGLLWKAESRAWFLPSFQTAARGGDAGELLLFHRLSETQCWGRSFPPGQVGAGPWRWHRLQRPIPQGGALPKPLGKTWQYLLLLIFISSTSSVAPSISSSNPIWLTCKAFKCNE